LTSISSLFIFLIKDIYRRIVDLHEREYLKSQNVVTETQCDLGLTALKLDEVLQLMSTDYPEKYHVRYSLKISDKFINYF
jgi:hypothetical protein